MVSDIVPPRKTNSNIDEFSNHVSSHRLYVLVPGIWYTHICTQKCGQFPMNMAAKSWGGYRERYNTFVQHSSVFKDVPITNNAHSIVATSTGVDGINC